MLAVALVVMVIFLFLRNAVGHRSFPARPFPCRSIGTFGVDVSDGVQPEQSDADGADDFHGIRRRRCDRHDRKHLAATSSEGDSPLQAALKGSEQIGFTILSLSISLIAVLIPLLFMGDVVGRLFREFAVTLSMTIVISAVVSLTLDADDVRPAAALPTRNRAGHVSIASQNASSIGRSPPTGERLRWVLNHQPATLLVAVVTLVFTILFYVVMPKGFFPVQDTGVILGISEAPQSISFRRHGRTSAGAGQGHPRRSGRREPVVVYRRGRHQHDAQQRTDLDQSQAVRRTQDQRAGRHLASAARARATSKASRCYCSRCRT